MKTILKVLFTLALSSTAMADCDQDVERFFDSVAPQSREILIQGHYTKKSRATGQYKACELSIKKFPGSLSPYMDAKKFNPSYGDGGAFWPFGTYPTVEPQNDHTTLSFSCSGDRDGFKSDYTFRQGSGWRKIKRYHLSLRANDDGTFDASIRDGDASKAVTCRGTISEK